MKILKNDTILVISGKDKGKKGKVITALPKEGKVVIEGANLRKKHTRKKSDSQKGQIVSMPAPMDISNVKIICSKCGKAVRVGYKIEGDKKFRICKECKAEI